jgi:serine/threonine protein kinase
MSKQLTTMTNPQDLFHIDGYEHIKTLDAPGIHHKGIAIVKNTKDQTFAICKLLPSLYPSVKEAEIMATLARHPHIPKLYKFIRAEHRSPYDCSHAYQCADVGCPNKYFDRIIMEYCDGGTLQDVLDLYHKRGADVPEAFIWEALEALVKTMCFLHLGISNVDLVKLPADGSAPRRYGWVPIHHNDMHASNVFLASTPASSLYPRVLVGDFGSATQVPGYNSIGLDVRYLVETIACLCFAKKGWRDCAHDVLRATFNKPGWIYSAELKRIILFANQEARPETDAGFVWELWGKVKETKEKARGQMSAMSCKQLIVT